MDGEIVLDLPYAWANATYYKQIKNVKLEYPIGKLHLKNQEGNPAVLNTGRINIIRLSYEIYQEAGNPPALIGAFTLGAIAISPSDSIGCVKDTIKAGVAAGYVVCETLEGLVEGTAGIVSLIADNIYGDTELAGAINTNNMIEYYS